jgi:hypothetical protein
LLIAALAEELRFPLLPIDLGTQGKSFDPGLRVVPGEE